MSSWYSGRPEERSLPAGRSPEWTLAILICATGLSLQLAFARTDVVWPDEQFQTIEPASRVVFGYGIMAWEWSAGFRSWVVPALFMPFLWLLKVLGIGSGAAVIAASRVLMSLASLAGLWGWSRLIDRRGWPLQARVASLGALALWPAMLLWSVTTLSDHLALVALQISLPIALAAWDDERPFRAGVWFGVPFLIRFQMGVWMPGIVLALLLRRPPLRKLAALAAGYAMPIAALGILDFATWGRPFHSIVKQLTEGIRISTQFGSAPPHEYLFMLARDLGWPLLAAAAFALVFTLARGRLRGDAVPVSLGALTFLGAHCAMSHKETRFILPMMPVLFLWIGEAIALIPLRLPRPALAAALFGIAAFGIRAAAHEPPQSPGLFDLETRIHDEGLLRRRGSGCVYMLHTNWTVTRGNLMQGADVTWQELKDGSPGASGCPYAIVRRDAAQELADAAPPRSWVLLQRSRMSEFDLYGRLPEATP